VILNNWPMPKGLTTGIMFLAMTSCVVVISAQGLVTCFDQKLFISSGNNAVQIGKCEKHDWKSPLVLTTRLVGVSPQPAEHDLALRLDQSKFKPKMVKSNKVQIGISSVSETRAALRVVTERWPRIIDDLFPPTLAIKISSGTLFRKVSGKPQYVETSTFTVAARTDWTISRLLDAVREAEPNREAVRIYGAYFYLTDPVDYLRLEASRSVEFYELTDGQTLCLFTSMR
jgi:hypothetical protein